jgi:hypothetical protein
MMDPRFSLADEAAIGARRVSPGELAEIAPDIAAVDLPGILAGRPIDLAGMKRRLPGQWSSFIRAHFRSSTEVGYFFGVDEKTARNWFNGTSEPRMSAFAALMKRCPQPARLAIVNYLAEAA